MANGSPEPVPQSNASNLPQMTTRQLLRSSVKRVVIKAGTSIVATPSGNPSLTRLAAIVEQVAELTTAGIEVILVTSGAVGVGKKVCKNRRMLLAIYNPQLTHPIHFLLGAPQLLRKQEHLNMSLKSSLTALDLESNSNSNSSNSLSEKAKKDYNCACAAAGQFGLLSVYSAMFDQLDLTASQLLLTRSDFTDKSRVSNLRYTVSTLIKSNIIPIINENDAVSANEGEPRNQDIIIFQN